MAGAGTTICCFTTDYVVDGELTLMKCRGEFETRDRGRAFVARRLGCPTVEVGYAADVQAAWQTFRRFGDKAWSFTDCVSRAVIERLSIATAFAFDDRFRQFGSVNVVPA